MCTRYVSLVAAQAMKRIFATTNPLINTAANYNIAPTQDAPAVRRNPATGQRSLDMLRFGLVPIWAKDLKIGVKLLNARGETVATLPAFRDAFKQRRCLVPADAFYEWHGEKNAKQAYAIALKSGETMAFAGLWERWKSPAGEIIRSFTIVTTEANDTLRPLHTRMPVILAPDAWPLWLGEAEGDPAALLRPCPEDWLRFWKVDKAVGNPRNVGANLLAPIEGSV